MGFSGRNGVQPTQQNAWGDWCNVKGTGFGVRPTTNTGDALTDAFVWVKPGGESDGTSDSSAARYDAHCGYSDALQPAPEAGTWFQVSSYTKKLSTDHANNLQGILCSVGAKCQPLVLKVCGYYHDMRLSRTRTGAQITSLGSLCIFEWKSRLVAQSVSKGSALRRTEHNVES